MHSLKIIAFCCFTSTIIAMKAPEIFDSVDDICHGVESRIDDSMTDDLREIVETENPSELFTKVLDYYRKQSSFPRNIFAYARHPLANAKKMILYWQLFTTTNIQVYEQALALKPQGNNNDEDNENDRNDEREILDKIYDEHNLDQIADDTRRQEWPFVSVAYDLEIVQSKLESVKKYFKERKEALLLPTQCVDKRMKEMHSKIKRDIDRTQTAITMIEERERIRAIQTNPFEFVLQKVKENSLLENLNSIASFYPTRDINAAYKAQNTEGNTLLHALCKQKLPADEFECAVLTLTDTHDLHINELNHAGQTPLEYVTRNDLGSEYAAILTKHFGALRKSSSDSSPVGSPIRQRKERKVQLPATDNISAAPRPLIPAMKLVEKASGSTVIYYDALER